MRNYAYLFLFSFVLMFLNSCEVAVKKVELNAHNIVLALDSTEMLSAKITPEEIPDSILYWQSSDTSIITVDNGLVKAKKIGSAAVIVWADDMSDTCFFDVKIRVDSINLNVRSVRIKNGSKAKLKATVYPSTATDTVIDWISSDSSVAVVMRGVVHARNQGVTLVSATIDGQTVDCRITVASIEEWMTSMARCAQREGGEVGGALRFTLQWNDGNTWNKNDLDAHCRQPKGQEIFYMRRLGWSGGMLDVDNRYPYEGVAAVENISWKNLKKMKKGKYLFFVKRFADRKGKDGFRAEIEFDGQIYSYSFNGKWKKYKTEQTFLGPIKFYYVNVAEVTLDEDGDFVIKNFLNPIE